MGRLHDCASSDDRSSERINDKRMKRKGEEKRKYLKTFELLPVQLLNAYGRAKYHEMEYDELWTNFKQPLKSGAAYMTELCDDTSERRGIGINRWAVAMRDFCKYQRREDVKKQNRKMLKEVTCTNMYEEIDKVSEALDYVCAGPKKKIILMPRTSRRRGIRKKGRGKVEGFGEDRV